MKRISAVLMSVVLVMALSGLASAAITFNEVPLGTSDPTIAGVSFWAGDPSVLHDTYTDDSWSSGNAYLMSGMWDLDPTYQDFIGVSPSGFTFATCSFDILSELSLPGGTTLYAVAYSSGAPVASTSLATDDNVYSNLSLSHAAGFDTVYIYDDSGNFFHIDNFDFTEYHGGGPVVPIPAPIALLGSGLAGGWFLKRRKRG